MPSQAPFFDVAEHAGIARAECVEAIGVDLAHIERTVNRTGKHRDHTTRAGRMRPAEGTPVSILVIEDIPLQRALYDKQISSWALQADLRFCENGYQALIEIARHKPDILLADIVMEGMDGYEVIRTIMADPQLADMHIAMLSSLSTEDLAERGGVPPGVVFFSKPVNYDELRGYLRACCADHARRASGNS